jgi:hypothetical protein
VSAPRDSAHLAISVGFGERLPVADDEFDLAYCCDVLEHVSDLAAVISGIVRHSLGAVPMTRVRVTGGMQEQPVAYRSG